MASYCLNSVDFHAVRFSGLLATGEEQYGARQQAVSETGISLGISPQVTEGTVSEQKNGRGILCGRKVGDDSVAQVNLTLVTCKLEPEMHYLMTGGEELTDGESDVIGWAMPDPSAAAADGVCMEAWTAAYDGEEQAVYGGQAATWRYVFPKVRWVLGDINLVEGVQTFTWNGKATPNSVIGDGPERDWPSAIDGPLGFFLDGPAPADFCGLQANSS